MSKMPAPASSHSKSSTASSAWSKLVQVTKTASRTSRHDDAKAQPVRRQSSPASRPAMTRSSRPVKRRRVTSSQARSASTPTRTPSSPATIPQQDADHHTVHSLHAPAAEGASTTETLREGAGNLGVSTRLQVESPVSGEGCSLLHQEKRKSSSTDAPSSSRTHADLRTLLGVRVGQRSSGQHGTSREDYESTKEKAEVAGVAADSVENGTTMGKVCEPSGYHTEDEPLEELPARDELDDASSSMAQRDDMNTAAGTLTRGTATEAAQTTSDDTARLSLISTPLRGRSKKQPRRKFGHKTPRPEDEITHSHDGQATITAKAPSPTADSNAEHAHTHAPAPPSSSPPAATPSLHASTPNTLNRPSEPTQPTTPTPASPQPSTPPTDKENILMRKPKRRLTLHDTHPQYQQHQQQQQRKKRKAAPKQTVQTTLALAIGGSAGMRECKVCDTVYNPFHPEDVKVHAKRHAGVVRKERAVTLV